MMSKPQASNSMEATGANPTPTLSLPFLSRLQLRIASVVTDATCRPNHTINRRLSDFLDRKLPADPTPRRNVSSQDVSVDASRHLWFRLFIPTVAATSSLPVIIYFHGGGFLFLSAASYAYHALCTRLARELNAVVVSVNYRLAPEHKFPAQYDDAFDVLRFLDADRRSIGPWPENADVGRCFLAGDSAGGNIAHHTAVRVCGDGGLTDVRVVGSVIIQPFFGGKERLDSEIRLEGAPIVSTGRTNWAWRAFLPDGLDRDHWAVDVSGPNKRDLSGLDLPPVMVVVGGFDPLMDWQRRYYTWLKESGKEVRLVEYPNACHAFFVFPDVAESSALIDDIRVFVEKQLSRVC